MDHLIVSLFGALLMPLFIVAVASSVMGIRSEAILMPLFNIFGMVLKLILQMALTLVRVVGATAMLAVARLLNVR